MNIDKPTIFINAAVQIMAAQYSSEDSAKHSAAELAAIAIDGAKAIVNAIEETGLTEL